MFDNISYHILLKNNTLQQSYEILPKAYGTNHLSTISGNLYHYDHVDELTTLGNTMVCAYDVENSIYTPITFGGKNACTITSSIGDFMFGVELDDPNGSGNIDLVLRAYAQNNNFEIYDDYYNNLLGEVHFVNNNITMDELDVNSDPINFTLPKSDFSAKAFWVIPQMEKIRDWYITTLSHTPEKQVIVWDPKKCGVPEIDMHTHIISLSHTKSIGSNSTSNCNNNLLSSLVNKDTMAHEYAHAQFLKLYEAKNSRIPSGSSYNTHSPAIITSPSFAWIEGWAFFMAIAYNETPFYQSSGKLGKWNFENRTYVANSDPNATDPESHLIGKPFPNGKAGEGNVAAILYDIIDATNEPNDDKYTRINDIWAIMNDNLGPGEYYPQNIVDFKNDWDDKTFQSLHNIFNLNTIPVAKINCDPSISGFVFSDDFECGFSSLWALSDLTNWRVILSVEKDRISTSNRVASVSNCDLGCNMTSNEPVNLHGYDSSTLNFWRYVDADIRGDYGLRVEINADDTTWTEIGEWTGNSNDNDDTWIQESISIDNYIDRNIMIRFNVYTNDSQDVVEIDDVTISRTKSDSSSSTSLTDLLWDLFDWFSSSISTTS